MASPQMPVAVAAGDATSAAEGGRVLAAGGSAADAAVAAMLTACVAETPMTGLAGGGFATVWEAGRGAATTVDFFVAVPGIGLDRPVAPPVEIDVAFGLQRMEYYAGAATVAVPGLPAGLAEVHRRWGRLPWAEVVEPARRVAEAGAPVSSALADVLGAVAPAMLLGGDGRRAYAPEGRLLQSGERLHHPGLAEAMAALRDHGAAAFTRGPLAADLLATVAAAGGRLTAADLDAYRVHVSPARTVRFAGFEVHARTDLLDLLSTLTRLPAGVGAASEVERVRAWVRALLGPDHPWGTTNVCAVGADGDACTITTSLGLGSGDWLPGWGVHLNSMLGEGELMRGDRPPGSRVDSMMCPLVVSDGDGLALSAGAAGGSRIRSALVQTLTGVLAQGLEPADAVERPRLNPVPLAGGAVLVHAEPGVDEEALAGLEESGARVQRWERQAAYFGGVSMIGRRGCGADPRRGGAVSLL